MSGTVALSIFLASALVCVVAEALIVRATVRVARAHPDAGPGFTLQRTALEIVWAVLPAVMLAVVLALPWRAVQAPPRRQTITPTGAAPAELPRR